MEYDKVSKALTTAADENDAFLVDLEIKPNNVIVAYVDADAGLTIEQIKMINLWSQSTFSKEILSRAYIRQGSNFSKTGCTSRTFKNKLMS